MTEQKLILSAIFSLTSTFDHMIAASVVFMEQVIKEERRLLAVFPVFFFYTFIGWMVLLQ
jgi:hypothetical protein